MPGKEFQIFLKGLQNKTNIIRIDEDASIARLRQEVSKLSGIPDDEFRVHYGIKELRSKNPEGTDMYLKDFNFHDEATIFMVLRLFGRSESRKMYGTEIELTDLPDMFTLEDDIGGQRTKMPCGHAVGPESLTAYCRSLLDDKRYEFRCPYKKNPQDPCCDTLWDLFTVKRLAVLTPDEIKEFETKIADNYPRKVVGIQECPKCQSFCERKRKKDVRGICPFCTKTQNGKLYEFCWFCLKTWRNPHATKECGNFYCNGKDPSLRIVEDCPKKEVVGVLCPAIRMCPTCGMLIEHKSQCKQMSCPCGQTFCFICLKKAIAQGVYQCGAWNFKCEAAPVQTAVPGD